MNSRVARVYVNNIEVGSLPADQYEQIIKNSKRNWKNYISQAFNILWVSWRIGVRIILTVPVIWFMVAFLSVIFDETILTTIFTAIQTNSPEQNTQYFKNTLNISVLISSLSIFLSSIFIGARSFGYVNLFDLAINRKIREILEVPTDGDVNVTVIDHNVMKIVYDNK